MKPTTFAKTALALALGMVAGAASAASTTTTAVSENFESYSADTAITNQTANNLTWTATGTADEATVVVESGNKLLNVDTDGLAASIATTQKDLINDALTNGTFQSVTFSSSIAFIPSSSEETFGEDNTLKFALYAIEGTGVTNLAVYAKETANGDAMSTTTAIGVGETLTDVSITITNATDGLKFQVSANNATSVWFYALSTSRSISGLDLKGTGKIDNIVFSYDEISGYSADDAATSTQGKVLTTAGADYLNAIVNKVKSKDAVDAAIANMTSAELDAAMAMNLDITDATADYEFKISDIKRSGNNVIVTISLDRTGALSDAIGGTATLYSCATPNGEYTTTAQTFNITGDGTAQVTFTGANQFFKVKISGSATKDAE